MNFSIIIPHYNIPQFLQRCIDSIPQQDDIEIIIVDDNSDSTIVDFDKFPGLDRKNTHVIFLDENLGGGAARNKGLDAASGRWVLFADADDFFHPSLSEILDQYVNFDGDMIIFNANCVYTDTLLPSKKNRAQHLNNAMHLYQKNKKKAELFFRYLFGEPWAKIVKRSLITENNIKFDETMIHNDTKFGYMLGFYAQKIIGDSTIGYCITERNNSVSKQLDETKLLTRVDVFSKALAFYEMNHLPVKSFYLQEQMLSLKKEKSHLYEKCMSIAIANGLSRKKIEKDITLLSIKKKIKKILKK